MSQDTTSNERDARIHRCIAEVRSGNERAFRDFVELTHQQIFRTSLAILHQHADAEEVTQDVYIKLYQQLTTNHAEIESISFWLRRVAINASIDFLRSTQRRWKRWKQHFALLGRSFLPATAHSQLTLKEVLNAMDILTEHQRTALTLHIVEGLTAKEIAALQQTSEKAIEQRIVRARRRLRRYLNTTPK